MWFSENRDYKHLVGLQRFDASCRKKLRLKVGQRVEALESLLKRLAKSACLIRLSRPM